MKVGKENMAKGYTIETIINIIFGMLSVSVFL